MDIEAEVRIVMQSAGKALTVDQVTEVIAEKIKTEVRSALNRLAKAGRLKCVRGSNRYPSQYSWPGPTDQRI